MDTPDIEIVIRFNPATGQVGFSGPLDQRLICYGMLEMAKEILTKQAEAPRTNGLIQPPNGLRLS